MVAVSLVLGSYAIRTVRIYEYFHPATAGEFLRTFRLVLLHNLFNNLLPMRSGEASFPILMAREFRVPFTRSIPGLVYLRVLDLHFVLLLGVAVLSWERGPLAWALTLFLAPLPSGFRIQGWLLHRLAGPGWPDCEGGRGCPQGLPDLRTAFLEDVALDRGELDGQASCVRLDPSEPSLPCPSPMGPSGDHHGGAVPVSCPFTELPEPGRTRLESWPAWFPWEWRWSRHSRARQPAPVRARARPSWPGSLPLCSCRPREGR